MIPLWLWILFAVLAFLILIALIVCFARIRLRIVFDKGLNLCVRVLFLRFKLTDREVEEKAAKPCPNPEKLLKKELRRLRKEEKKAARKKRRAEKKARKGLASDQNAPKPLPLTIKEKLELVLALIKHCYKETNGRIKIKIRKLYISIGTDDAAKTAILYGAVAQGTAELLQLVTDGYIPIQCKEGAVAVAPDYISGKCRAELDVTCSVTILHALLILLGLLDAHRIESARAQKKAEKRLAKKQKKQETAAR